MVNDILEGNARRIDVPLPASQSDWWNTSVCYPNYPYEFNPDRAKQLLDNEGFADRDNDGKRNYPMGTKQREAGPNLDPIILYVDIDDRIRTLMAESLAYQMNAAEIPVDLRECHGFQLYAPIITNHDYHIFVGSQLVNSIPFYLATICIFMFMYPSFGTQLEYPNFWRWWPQIRETIEHTGYMQICDELWKSLTWEDALRIVKQVQGMYTDNAFEVPVCSIKSYFAYRNDVAGIVNEDEYGPDSLYTYLNAYRTDNQTAPVRVGIIRSPEMLNILYSNGLYDYQCLDKIYAGLISFQPYSPTVAQPWVAQDWATETWLDPEDGQTKTCVDYWFRKDVKWVAPVTGQSDGNLTAKHYEFACYYIYAQDPFVPGTGIGCPHLDKFKDIYNVTIIDDYHVRVYMNVRSTWAYLWPTYPLLPKHKWLTAPLAYNDSACFQVGRSITLPGRIPLTTHVVSGSSDTQVKVLLADGTTTWLTWGTDFTWKKGDLYVKIASLSGKAIQRIWVYYWRNGDARGYCPGGLSWQTILEGCGTHYATNLDVDDFLVLNANRNFFLETPTLGEIDWMWTFQGTNQPRSGYYQVFLYDSVRALGAYGSRGTAVPDPNWFPGADIDQNDVGHVGLFDLALINSNYGAKFGIPPP
jgi:ABC-type transport system substrate-binding protein